MLEFLYYLIFREALAEDSNESRQKENLKNIRIDDVVKRPISALRAISGDIHVR